MASKATASSSEPKITLEELMEKGYEHLISKIRQLRKKIEAGRHKQVEENLDKSGKMLQNHTHELLSATCMTNSSAQKNSLEVPHLGVESALCVLDGFPTGEVDTDLANIHEIIDVNSTKLPKVQRIPSYTTWLFLDRNQRMAEDQSVVGRRRIYYDQFENEALICSDSEDDIADIEEEKREFSDGEDQILSMALREYGLNKDVADVVSHFIGGSSSEILERYNDLKLKSQVSNAQGSTERNVFLEKSLSAALDSFENLFCRRCLVFDCRLHGCFQSVVYPSEKQLCGPESQDRKPCSDQCYLRAGQTVDNPVEISNGSSLDQIEGETSVPKVLSSKNKKDSGSGDRMCNVEPKAEEGPTRGVPSAIIDLSTDTHTYVGKRKTIHDHREELEKTDSFADSFEKKQKKIQFAEASTVSDEEVSATAILSSQTRFSNSKAPAGSISQLIDKHFLKGTSRRSSHNFGDELCVFSERLALEQSTASFKARRKGLLRSSKWKPLEKDLYVKGLEIFGKNSCLIARNLLSGLKTCTEVFNYMRENGAVKTQNKDSVRCLEDRAGADTDNMEQDILMRPRSKLFRKRGRRLKYSSKSNGHPSRRKRINNNENRPCKQYSPCTCQSTCGKDCSCAKVGNCCEKYCGCPKSCKNRFRGCHCAKSQCRSRQCPCFAANRECDPDVCRNCWVSCGGGSLGEPVKKGDGQCGNMRLLLRQQKRVLLGRSDVSGWGAFIKDAVNKNDYLGEYTGELVSHREADKRGKMYDRANSSFLFDLNDQYVLDAYRHGDKLKFANHSLKPNCYCKVVLVKGDHRIGIFAKERIDAKEELFYDYCYGPDQAPEWARKPGSSKKEDSQASQGRARKHQSR